MSFKSILFVILLLPLAAISQDKKDENEKSETSRIWNIEFKAGYDVPFADMGVRFGNSFRLGGGLKLKTKNNWTFGLEHQFIVGGKIKEPGFLQNLFVKDGGIINEFGEEVNVGVFQRGYMTGIHIGKILPYLNKTPNSGLTVQTGIGFMQYKINLFDEDNNIGPLKTDPNTGLDYKKGYDRLTNGIYLKQFVGYTHYSKNKLINFVSGFDFIYGFNQGRRDFLFDVQKPGTDKRQDILVGFHFTWVIPIYKKMTEETYY